MDRSGRRIWADILMALIAIGIIYMTIFYKSEGPFGLSWADKAFHAGAFFILVFPGAMVHRWAFLWLVPLAIGFGAAIEWIQPYFGRGRELNDLYADIIGVMAGLIAGTLVRIWRR